MYRCFKKGIVFSYCEQLFAQEVPNNILDFIKVDAKSEVTMPIPSDTLLYVFVPVSKLNLDFNALRVDNDTKGVFSFYKVGPFSVMESRRNNGRVRFSVIRK